MAERVYREMVPTLWNDDAKKYGIFPSVLVLVVDGEIQWQFRSTGGGEFPKL